MLKGTFTFSLLMIMVLLFSLSSCFRYDEGPFFSFRSVKNRVSGNWELLDISSFALNEDIFYEMDKDGRVTRTTTFEQNGEMVTEVSDGTWNFEDGKKDLEITFDGESPRSYDIQKLTNQDMWLREKVIERQWEFKKVD